MKGFFQGLAIIVALILGWVVVAAISPQGGLITGVALLVVSLVALVRPVPSLGLHRRRFSAALVLCAGLPATLASLGMLADETRLAELRASDPAAYLTELRKKDEGQWLSELAVLDPEQHEAERAARDAEARAVAETREAEAAARQAEEQAAKVTSYVEQIDRELADLPGVNAANYTASVDGINMAIILMGAWTRVYEKGADLPLDAAAQQKRQRFRELLVRKQAEMLPVLRDAYGPAMRRHLWDADGSARTFGAGYRTVELVHVGFARNANIRDIHNKIREHLLMLRFTRAHYKWFRGASEYSYVTLDPPSDTDLVIWESGGRYRIIP